MIYVGSLKYSPVYKSHCCAFGKCCEEEGYDVKYLFSRDYQWMLSDDVRKNTIFVGASKDIPTMLLDSLNPRNYALIKKNFFRDKPTHVYMLNYHPLNHQFSRLSKQNGGKFIFHMHEPHVKNKHEYGSFARYYLYANEIMEERLLRDTDVVILSSKEASRQFTPRYPWFAGKTTEVPLIYEDLGEEITPKNQRKYVTFVGPTVPSKGPEIFLRIVDYSAKHDLGFSFLLISRDRITDSIFYNHENLTVFCRNRISDKAYGEFMRKSIAVLVPYKRTTQSSVLLVSYMYGTPVVSSDSGGLPEFVKQGKTGYVVDLKAPVETWIEKIRTTVENFGELSINCRNYFVESFSGKNWKKILNEVLI